MGYYCIVTVTVVLGTVGSNPSASSVTGDVGTILHSVGTSAINPNYNGLPEVASAIQYMRLQ